MYATRRIVLVCLLLLLLVVAMSKQVLCRSVASVNISNTATDRLDVVGGSGTGGQVRGTIWPCTGVWRNLEITLDVAPGVGKSWTYTFHINNVATAMTITISGTATTGISTGDVAITALDRVLLEIVPSGTPAAANLSWSLEFDGTTAKQSGYAFSSGTVGATAIYQGIFSAVENNWLSSVPNNGQKTVVAAAGSLTRFAIDCASAFSPGEGYNIYVNKNGVRQDGSGGTVNTLCAVIGVQQASATYVLPVVPGDIVYYEGDEVGTASTVGTSIGCQFTSTVDGESQFSCTPSNNLNGSVATYIQPSGSVSPTWVTAESFLPNLFGGVTTFGLKTLHVLVQTAPGAGNSHTFTARKNSADAAGGPVVTISDSATSGADLVGNYTIADGDRFSLKDAPVSTPSGGFASWTYIQTIGVVDPEPDPEPGPGPAPSTGEGLLIQMCFGGSYRTWIRNRA